MKRFLLKSKIHRASVTQTDLDYEGSISIDRELMDAADIAEHEQVQVYDISNGQRLTTKVAEAGSGIIGINGAAARLVESGNLMIIASYAEYDEAEVREHRPRIVLVDHRNRPLTAASFNRN